MRIGVLSEGHADRAVIVNLITGLTGLDVDDIEAIRPIDTYDETDKARKDPKTFSSWTVVREECQTRELIDGFLSLQGNDFVAIHLDSAEADEYGVTRPIKGPNYCIELRDLVITEMIKWFGEDISESILYAIAVEEIDAWLLTIHEPRDSTTSATPKEKFSRLMSKKGIDSTSDYANYLKLSKPFTKTREITRGKFLSYNCSLEAFYNEVREKVLPRLD